MSDLNAEAGKDKNNVPYQNEILTFISAAIPSTKYLESRFDHLQSQIDDLRRNQDIRFTEVNKQFEQVNQQFEQVDKRFEQVDKRFEQVDKRFEQVDKRFDQVDKRFDQVDKRFEQMIASIDKLGDKLEYRDRDQRGFTIKMFSIAIAISLLGVLGAFFKIIGVF